MVTVEAAIGIKLVLDLEQFGSFMPPSAFIPVDSSHRQPRRVEPHLCAARNTLLL
jgi:hypothetical protein